MDTQGFIGDNAATGQGLAYVLPNSRTESYAIQLNQERAAQQRAEADLLEKQKEAQNTAYANHLYATKIPEHNAQWDAAINPVFQKYIQDAADYHAKTGKDAFGQPEFVQRRNDLLNLAAKSNQSAKTAVGLSTLLNDDKDNKLNPDDKQRIAQALVAYNADPVKNSDVLNGLTASAKPYDITDAQKLLKPTTIGTNNGYFDITQPDRHKHVIQAQDILADPKFNQLKTKNGINPTVGDVFHIQDVNGTHYPTDEPTVRRFAQHILQDPTLPGSAATLQAAGIDPADPNAEQKLTELGMKQNQGYGNLVSGLADYADARAKSDKKRVFTADNNDRSAMKLELATEKFNIAKDKASAGAQLTPAQIQVQQMQGGDPNAVNNFLKLAPSKQYGDQAPKFSVDGLGNHVYNFPAQVIPDPKAIAANKALKDAYNASPDKKNKTLGLFGGDKVPYEQSDAYKESKDNGEILPETKVKKPAITYTLNPNSGADYMTQAAQMANDQNIKLPQVNSILAKKGGRGIIPQVAPKKPTKNDPLGLGI
jgi:hypothetical protein